MCSAGPVHRNPDHDFGHNAVSVDGIFEMKQKCRTSDDSDSWFALGDKRADEAFHSYSAFKVFFQYLVRLVQSWPVLKAVFWSSQKS